MRRAVVRWLSSIGCGATWTTTKPGLDGRGLTAFLTLRTGYLRVLLWFCLLKRGLTQQFQ